MTIRKIDAGLYVEAPTAVYCCPIRPVDGTEPTMANIRSEADDRIVAGPLELDDAIRQAAKMNKELEEK